MGLIDASGGAGGFAALATPHAKKDAAGMLESLMVKQILQASGAFKGAGGTIHNELFVDAIADAVAKGGGLGIGKVLDAASVSGSAPMPGPTGLPTGAPPTTNPVPGAHLTSAFGPRSDPFSGETKFHRGVDLAAQEGTPVLAAQSGVVKQVGDRGGYGLAVEIEHEGGVTTLYGHASELLVRPGDRIEKGQPIARVGHSGRATGDH